MGARGNLPFKRMGRAGAAWRAQAAAAAGRAAPRLGRARACSAAAGAVLSQKKSRGRQTPLGLSLSAVVGGGGDGGAAAGPPNCRRAPLLPRPLLPGARGGRLGRPVPRAAASGLEGGRLLLPVAARLEDQARHDVAVGVRVAHAQQVAQPVLYLGLHALVRALARVAVRGERRLGLDGLAEAEVEAARDRGRDDRLRGRGGQGGRRPAAGTQGRWAGGCLRRGLWRGLRWRGRSAAAAKALAG
jgi:hypothetical protein